MVSSLQSLLLDIVRDTVYIAFVFLIGKLLIRGTTAAVLASMSVANKSEGFKERADTIRSVIRIIGNTILYSVLLFLVLDALGIDIAPLLAGAGALGLIAGLGSQTLIKDFVSGILISAEDQYRVGERVKINAIIEGTVLQIAMRLTTLRGDDGEIHHILNSSITMVTNFSRK